ncbi:MAG: MBL fold metallo-hydrolase, partial [Patescibacteria group bacterium]|nr:MBL fold metallo-hydrolase [Patescibacteria group bacterium]
SVINPGGLDYVVPIHYGATSCPMVNADVNIFLNSLNKYNVGAKPLVYEVGEEKDIMGIKVTFLGGGSWFFVTPTGTRFLIDPAMQFNAQLLEKFKDISQFERIDMILLTHGHFDHISVEDMQKWTKAYDPITIAPYELGVYLSGYIESPILSINVGGGITEREWGLTSFDPKRYERMKDMKIHLVHAFHSSVATPAGTSAHAADQYMLK